ncbi:uroporphyrinogen-III synthase [Tumebacillus sp. BK434]|uniref:uroporphyrinogen-III synthase n=1 Tax=Tumebacillus sp. BK434 TaxID=2512169 RepID=UPI00104E4DB4|nr:uroporphyrinogen-III synthase [Tumebacillus sp. BK434]TCP54769.1 uroporphyrinogen-III synthase [Tumebacillus sp. BK434]
MSAAAAKPFLGKRIVVTRSRSQASELSRMIEELGGIPVEFPVIRTDWPDDLEPLDRALSRLGEFDWIILTSVTGVEMFFERMKQTKHVLPPDARARFAAVGSKTAAAIERHGVPVAVTAEEFVAEGLLRALDDQVQPGQQVLFPRANIARKLLPDAMRAKGCLVTEVDAYQTLAVTDEVPALVRAFQANEIHAVTFTSSSTVNNFLAALQGHDCQSLLQGVVLAAIGPITQETAERHGLTVDVTADTYTIPGLVEALDRFFTASH